MGAAVLLCFDWLHFSCRFHFFFFHAVFSAWLKSFVDLSISILAFHFAARTYLCSALKNNFLFVFLFFTRHSLLPLLFLLLLLLLLFLMRAFCVECLEQKATAAAGVAAVVVAVVVCVH